MRFDSLGQYPSQLLVRGPAPHSLWFCRGFNEAQQRSPRVVYHRGNDGADAAFASDHPRDLVVCGQREEGPARLALKFSMPREGLAGGITVRLLAREVGAVVHVLTSTPPDRRENFLS